MPVRPWRNGLQPAPKSGPMTASADFCDSRTYNSARLQAGPLGGGRGRALPHQCAVHMGQCNRIPGCARSCAFCPAAVYGKGSAADSDRQQSSTA